MSDTHTMDESVRQYFALVTPEQLKADLLASGFDIYNDPRFLCVPATSSDAALPQWALDAVRRFSEYTEHSVSMDKAIARIIVESLPSVSPDAAATARLAAEEIVKSYSVQEAVPDPCDPKLYPPSFFDVEPDVVAAILMRHFAPIYVERDALKGEVERQTQRADQEECAAAKYAKTIFDLRTTLAASNEQRDELERALELLKAACTDVLLPAVNEAIKSGYKMETWTHEQMQWAKAVEVVDATLTRIRANRTTV